MNYHWTIICQNVSWCSPARVFRPRKPMGKLRPISPYETALLDETLQEFISRREKRLVDVGETEVVDDAVVDVAIV